MLLQALVPWPGPPILPDEWRCRHHQHTGVQYSAIESPVPFRGETSPSLLGHRYQTSSFKLRMTKEEGDQLADPPAAWWRRGDSTPLTRRSLSLPPPGD